jgi:hypothetical protein
MQAFIQKVLIVKNFRNALTVTETFLESNKKFYNFSEIYLSQKVFDSKTKV